MARYLHDVRCRIFLQQVSDDGTFCRGEVEKFLVVAILILVLETMPILADNLGTGKMLSWVGLRLVVIFLP